MIEVKDSCVKPAKGPMMTRESKTSQLLKIQREEIKMIAQVGKPVPDLAGKVWKIWKPEMAF